MKPNKLSSGVVHTVPSDMRDKITSKKSVLAVWEDITPLARNEWICWVEGAVKQETRERRLRIMQENLQKGKRRPCCWAGCFHRK